MQGTEFDLIPEDRFVCQSNQDPVSCLYHFNPLTDKFEATSSVGRRLNYSIEVAASFDGNTLRVKWNKDTLFVADDQIRRFQVLLQWDAQYMASIFPVAKDQYEFVLDGGLPSDVFQFNICVEVIGIYNDVITFRCVSVAPEVQASRTHVFTHIALPVIVPIVLVIITITVLSYLTCARMRKKPVQSSGPSVQGINNAMYDHHFTGAEEENASQVTFWGLPSSDQSAEAAV